MFVTDAFFGGGVYVGLGATVENETWSHMVWIARVGASPTL